MQEAFLSEAATSAAQNGKMSSTTETNGTSTANTEPQQQPQKPIKIHPALPQLTWQSIAEGLGDIFKGNMVRNPVDISFSNVTYTASLGFRKGKLNFYFFVSRTFRALYAPIIFLTCRVVVCRSWS